jgi:hypothetical protein
MLLTIHWPGLLGLSALKLGFAVCGGSKTHYLLPPEVRIIVLIVLEDSTMRDMAVSNKDTSRTVCLLMLMGTTDKIS